MNSYLAQIIGGVSPPPGVARYSGIGGSELGIQLFISNIMTLCLTRNQSKNCQRLG